MNNGIVPEFAPVDRPTSVNRAKLVAEDGHIATTARDDAWHTVGAPTLTRGLPVTPPSIAKKPHYKKPVIVPISSEREFSTTEMFISTTDLHGVIQSGNEVFVRISQHAREDLIGSPHNIIRHPDMPRVVFKLLWNTLQAGQPISAYVKNMAKDGRYYWVVANFFPVRNDEGQVLKFISVRIKPQAHIFTLVPDIYRRLLEVEKDSGMEGAAVELGKILEDASFPDYSAFMQHILIEEMKCRIAQEGQTGFAFAASHIGVGSRQGKDGVTGALVAVHEQSAAAGRAFRRIFAQLDMLQGLATGLVEITGFVQKLSRDVELSAMNTAIHAASIAGTSSTFYVIAKDVKENADAGTSVNAQMMQAAQETALRVRALAQQIVLSQFQIDMIFQFAGELLQRVESGGSYRGDEIDELRTTCIDLLSLVDEGTRRMNSEVSRMAEGLRLIVSCVNEERKVLRRLLSVQGFGKIQSVYAGNKAEKLVRLFTRIRERAEEAGARIDEYSEQFRWTNEGVYLMQEALLDIDTRIESMWRSIKGLQ